MTRPIRRWHGGVSRPHLGVVVHDRQKDWADPFLMTVIGDERVFRILEPAVGPHGHIAPGAHFFRTLTPFLVGYTEPGDGSYAEALRRAHEEAGVPTALIAETIGWNASVMVQVAARYGHAELVDDLTCAARGIAEDANCDPELITASRLTLDRTFGSVQILPEMREALWQVLGWADIRKMHGETQPTDNEILDISRLSLEAEFVDQFRRF